MNEGLHLHLFLKHEHYDAIDAGQKKVEYRKNIPYWRKRIMPKWNSNGGNMVIFHKSYTKTIMVFFIKSLVINGNQIELHLGERLLPSWERWKIIDRDEALQHELEGGKASEDY